MIDPKNIHCLALNYKGVGNNKTEPLYFVKSLSSLCFDNATIKYPKDSNSLWSEVELGVVIAKDCHNLTENNVEEFIEGFIVCGDITCDNIHNRDHHLGFSKSRNNYCPISSNIIKIDKEILMSLTLKTIINGEITQVGNISQMNYNPYQSLIYISSFIKLKKGDIILTGTPAGVENNILKVGDIVIHEIDQIGQVSFKVKG